MAEKLKLVLKIVRSQLLLKAAIFAGLLFWVKISNFSVLPVFLFLLTNTILYFRGRGQNNSETIGSSVILLIISLFGVSMIGHLQFLIPAIILYSVIFYLILGIKDLVFVQRGHLNYFKNILLFYSIFLTYFLSDKYDLFFIKYSLVFVFTFLLVYEWLFWSEKSFVKRRRIIAMVFSLLVLQLTWGASLLPLGFVNSATLMTVLIYIMFDFCLHHFQGTISKELILKNSAVLALSAFFIFIFTNWHI